jgi:universal stress protein E
MQLLRKSPCPVWIMAPRDKDNYRRILAAVDFDPWRPGPDSDAINRKILELAISLALSDFADLHLVHSREPLSPDMMRLWSDESDTSQIASYIGTEQLRHQEGLERLTHQLKGWIGAEVFDYLAPRLHLPRGSAAKAIPALAERLKFDLVLHGLGGPHGHPRLPHWQHRRGHPRPAHLRPPGGQTRRLRDVRDLAGVGTPPRYSPAPP